MEKEVSFRVEQVKDYEVVEQLIEAAFKEEKYSDQNEHILVAKLRRSPSFIPELSIIAELDGEIVGHILLTKINIKNESASFASLALAPVSVLPIHQRKGIGGQLIRKAHEEATQLGYQSVVLLGHAQYYPRFGYQKASQFGIRLPFDVPDENCMAIELVKGALNEVSGVVEYDPAFYE